MSKEKVEFVDNVNRRKWDVEKYEAIAKAKEAGITLEAEDGHGKPKPVPAAERAPLKARDTSLDLEKRIGAREIVSATTAADKRGGYYCQVCKCLLRDSIAYLDHINGKNHQRNLGMSMRAERSSVSDVRRKLQEGKRKLSESEGETSATKRMSLAEWEELMKKREEELRRQRVEESMRLKKKAEQEEEEHAAKHGLPPAASADDEMARVMGITGFGGSKKT